MAERKPAKKTTKGAAASGRSTGLSADEKAAMREYLQEKKANKTKEEEAEAVVAKIAKMAPADRAIAQRLHKLITSTAPSLSPKTWYGMPAYAKDGKVICFFQDAAKFKARYATLGFNDGAKLDDGAMWPTAFALRELTRAEEARIAALLKKAAG